MPFEIRPVTPDRWEDFVALFSARGCPHYCWCMVYRDRQSHALSKDQRRDAMRKRIRAEVPVGVLAYAGGEPVGWCSIGPRETFPKLENSRTMPRVDDLPTWTILCLFVKSAFRGQGVTRDLVRGAVAYAKENGAKRVEAYPYDTAGITSRHRGHSSMFRSGGFRHEAKRWVRRLR